MATTTTLIVIYFIVLSLYGFTEIFLQRKFLKKKSEKPDAGVMLIIFPFYAALYLPIPELLMLKSTLHLPTIIAGFVVFVFGFAIRIKGLMTLKHNFSIAVECKDKNFLVTNGIYKYVRHPLYLSVVLMAASGCLVFSSVVCWLFYIIMLYGIYLRIEKEETFLLLQFEEYASYCTRTKKIIPFVF